MFLKPFNLNLMKLKTFTFHKLNIKHNDNVLRINYLSIKMS